MATIDRIKTEVRCGSCGGRIDRPNLCSLNRLASWKYPTAGNVLTGESNRAVAILCDACVDSRRTVNEAVELTDDGVVYHPLETLPELPPERTYVLTPGGWGIRCLKCGLTSWNLNDVANLYCGYCHEFHEGE